MKLTLNRPLVSIDLETTGLDVNQDRIVEIALIRRFPNGNQDHIVARLNPDYPIGPGASAVNGITNADVEECPYFIQLAPMFLAFLRDCDLCGFNIINFDLPMLSAEFSRAGYEWPTDNMNVVDVSDLFRLLEPRNLKAAVKKYLGIEFSGMHKAAADATVTLLVLDAQVATQDPKLGGAHTPEVLARAGLNQPRHR